MDSSRRSPPIDPVPGALLVVGEGEDAKVAAVEWAVENGVREAGKDEGADPAVGPRCELRVPEDEGRGVPDFVEQVSAESGRALVVVRHRVAELVFRKAVEERSAHLRSESIRSKTSSATRPGWLS